MKFTREKSLCVELKDTLYYWAKHSTLDGFPNIFKSKYLSIKLIWLVCFIGSAGFGAYSVTNSILNYFQYGVKTTITTIAETPMEFPTVTFCNINPFTTQVSVIYTSEFLAQSFISGVDSPIFEEFAQYPSSQITANIYVSEDIMLGNAYQQSDNVKQSFSLPRDDFIIYCSFGSNRCNNSELKWFYHDTYGNCYQFNIGQDSSGNQIPLKKSTEAGKKNGLNLILFTGAIYNTNTPSFMYGAHVIIHNSTESPKSNEGIDVPGGKEMNVVVDRQLTSKQPMPYSNCYKNLTTSANFYSAAYYKTLKFNYTYRQENCIQTAIQQFFADACNCTDGYYAAVYGLRVCTTIFDKGCEFQAISKAYAAGEVAKTANYCPLECSRYDYFLTTSYADFPSESYGNLLLNDSGIQRRMTEIGMNMTFEELKKSVVSINIYYEEMQYTYEYETPAQNWITLIGSIGGTLMLYTGMSVLSLVEIADILIQMIFLICCCVTNRSYHRLRHRDKHHRN